VILHPVAVRAGEPQIRSADLVSLRAAPPSARTPMTRFLA